MARYGLATILESHPVGLAFAADRLPLHMSIVDSFEIDLGVDELVGKLAILLAEQRSFRVRALADTMFGPESDIPVTTLELTTELKTLHERIVSFIISEAGALRYPQFNGEYYSPHVSVYGDRKVNVGDEIAIKDVSLPAKVNDAPDADRRILANFSFV